MFLYRLLIYIRWPAVIGLLCALLILQFFPQFGRQTTVQQQNNGTALQPLTQTSSYSDAVGRAAAAVVSVYTKGSSAAARINAQQFFAIYLKNPDFYSLYSNVPRCRYLFDTDPRFRERYHREPIFRDSIRFSPLLCEVYERTLSNSTGNSSATALGSGVIATQDGHILTNKHVVDNAQTIVVQLQDGREAEASLIGSDAENDLAVLKIELGDLTTIAVGAPEEAQVGDIVLAIGNPVGIGQTVTQGIISATGRRGLGINAIENFIQTDAAINPGNSGGALIDIHGHLIGINTATFDRAGSSDLDGVGLAVPANTAIQTLKEILEHGHVERGWLGVEAEHLSLQLARSLNLERGKGLVITRLHQSGPAFSAGLQPQDIILKISGEWVGSETRGQQKIAESRPGDKVMIEYLRSNKRNTTVATLAKRPTTR